MPKLSPVQWLLFAVFLFFYGFTIFAVTRDYYVRQIARPVAPGSSPHGMAAQTTPGSQLPPASAIPQAVTESNPDLLASQADDLFAQRRFAEAVPLYRRLLELNPDDVETYNDLGLALHYLGDSKGALTQLRAGTVKDPSHQRIWLTLGFVTLQSGDAAAARAALEQARDLGAENQVGAEAVRLLELIPPG
jgi:Flp pilus assembly protein TadD